MATQPLSFFIIGCDVVTIDIYSKTSYSEKLLSKKTHIVYCLTLDIIDGVNTIFETG